MELGASSISLAVKDLEASRRFHEKFGFQALAGDASRNWLIPKNGDHVIGLFPGMFEQVRGPADERTAGPASLSAAGDLQR